MISANCDQKNEKKIFTGGKQYQSNNNSTNILLSFSMQKKACVFDTARVSAT